MPWLSVPWAVPPGGPWSPHELQGLPLFLGPRTSLPRSHGTLGHSPGPSLPRTSYLAVEPVGGAEKARTGPVAGEAEGAPAGAALGPGAAGAAAQGPLAAGGGGGRPEGGAPQSGAGGRAEKVAQRPRRRAPTHLTPWCGLWSPFRISAEAHVGRVGQGRADLQALAPIKPTSRFHEERNPTVKPRTPSSHMPPSLNLTGGGLRRRLRSWGLAPGFWGRRRGPGGGGPGAAPGGPCGAPGGAGAAPWGWGCPVAAEAPTVP